ncbi:MAG: transcription antitermination factor NusB [Rickettsiaceae bacterium]|nr:transcription antitermination factor NusB [Rickettsiaceae bacterium]
MTIDKINNKSISRIAAIQTLYQHANSEPITSIEITLEKIIDYYKNSNIDSDYGLDNTSKNKLKPSYKHLQELVTFTNENITEIDKIITSYLKQGWTIETLPILLLSILRVAITEIKFFPEIGAKIIINEYTDIASDMLNENEIGFVNSVLDKFAKQYR